MTRLSRAGVFSATAAQSNEELIAKEQQLLNILAIANEADKRDQLEAFIAAEKNYVTRNAGTVSTTPLLGRAERALLGLGQAVPAFSLS